MHLCEPVLQQSLFLLVCTCQACNTFTVLETCISMHPARCKHRLQQSAVENTLDEPRRGLERVVYELVVASGNRMAARRCAA